MSFYNGPFIPVEADAASSNSTSGGGGAAAAAAAASAQGQLMASAFTFGILLQTTIGAFGVLMKGYWKTLLKDQRRLVLAIFLISSFLWSQISFIETQIPPTVLPACQVLLFITTILDQLARISIEAFLFWSVAQSKSQVEQNVYAVILAIRTIAGGVYVGFTQAVFTPSCTPIATTAPATFVVLILDAVIIMALLIRAFTSGLVLSLKDNDSDNKSYNKAIFMGTTGFAIWSATSVPEILRLPSLPFALKNALPAASWQILIIILMSFAETLFIRQERSKPVPEASSPSPFNDTPRPLLRVTTDNTGSPVIGREYNGRNLFVVNPSSATASASESPIAQPMRVIDKGASNLNSMNASTPPEYRMTRVVTPPRPAPPIRDSNDIFMSTLAPVVTAGPSTTTTVIQGGLSSLGGGSGLAATRALSANPPANKKVQQKRGFFGLGGSSNESAVRKIPISNPIMAPADPAAAPFTRIPTVDLETAARNEKRRREDAAMARELIAKRPPPPLPTMQSLENGLRRSTSIKRKDAPVVANPPLPTQTLSVSQPASSTSASLSPGREELRRRSPRTSPRELKQFDEEKLAFPRPPVQRPTTGLPSGPRSQMMTSKDQTVMLIKNIEYDDPVVVQSIMDSAPTKTPTRPLKPFKAETEGSIIHRPRPIKREDSDKERAIFPAEPSPLRHHRRGKSTPSIALRKSNLRTIPGSPTNLPILPAPPTTASALKRILPVGEAMTKDEQLQLLFPAPPSGGGHKRRSSVPSLPVSRNYSMGSPTLGRFALGDDPASRRTSKRTTISSFATTPTTAPGRSDIGHETYRFSASTYSRIASLHDSWLEERYSAVVEGPDASTVRQSSSDGISSHASSPSIWASLKSPVQAVAMTNAKPTLIGAPVVPKVPDVPSRFMERPQTIEPSHGELMTIMLDPGDIHAVGRQDESATTAKRSSAEIRAEEDAAWHRRIGQDVPAFSESRRTLNPRAMPPPTPLLLAMNNRQKPVSEPSPPMMESPTKAIQELQAQLRKFDEAERLQEAQRTPIGSIFDSLPVGGGNRGNSLLESLEQEMGQQESQWQTLHHNFDRDSNSTLRSSVARDIPNVAITMDDSALNSLAPTARSSFRASLAKRSSTLSAILADQSDMSRASMWERRLAAAEKEYLESLPGTLQRNSKNFMSMAKAQLGSPTPPDSLHSDSDLEFEVEEEIERQAFIARIKMNPAPVKALWVAPIPSVTRAAPMWVAQAPRIADEKTMMPAKSLRPAQRRVFPDLKIQSSALWSKPTSPVHLPVQTLWGTRAEKKIPRPLTRKPPRRSRRNTMLPDILESPEPLPNKRDTLGIFQFPWGEKSDSAIYQVQLPPMNAAPRIDTNFKPALRQAAPENNDYSSSFFDDYDEEFEDDPEFSPESDDEFDDSTLIEIANMLGSADVPSRGSMFPRGSRIIEDYEEEEVEMDTNNRVPMKLPIQPLTKTPPFRQSLGLGQATMSTRHLSKALPPVPVVPKAPVSAPAPALTTAPVAIPAPIEDKSKLWTRAKEIVEEASEDLFTPGKERKSWRTTDAAPAAIGMVKTPRSSVVALPTLSSSQLWSTSETVERTVPANSTTALWGGDAIAPPAIGSPQKALLWSAKVETTTKQSEGLFTANSSRPSYRTTETPVIGSSMLATHRPLPATLDQLTSQKLWAPAMKVRSINNWIFGAPEAGNNSRRLLWASPIKIQAIEHDGLFSITESRHRELRTTDKPVVARTMSTPRRAVSHTPVRVSSQNLWKVSKAPSSKTHWMHETSRPASSSHSSLWIAPVKRQTIQGTGLFAVEVARHQDLRTTQVPVIGINMTTVRRQSSVSLDSLTSQRLWTRPKSCASDMQHWLLDTTDFALSPTVYSPSSSGSSSPASITSSVTSASTLGSAVRSSFVEIRGTSRIPVIEKKSSNPMLSKAEKSAPLPKIPEQFMQFQFPQPPTNNGISRASALPQLKSIKTSALPIPRSAAPIQVASKSRVYSHRGAKKADWEAALAEAVSAGRAAIKAADRPRVARPACSPADWDAALREAMGFDAALRHPVFFTSSMTTSAKDVHPAAIGYVKLGDNKSTGSNGRSRAMTWTKPAAVTVPISQVSLESGLWNGSVPTMSSAQAAASVKSVEPMQFKRTPRSSLAEEAMDKEKIKSQSLWKALSTMPEDPKNWLEDNRRLSRVVEFRY